MDVQISRPARPTAWRIFLAFSKVGLTSFGGGLSGWLLQEFVQTRAWITEEEFMTGLSLSQAFPGVNVVNVSIWIGFRLRGGWGALAGGLGMVVPPMLAIIFVAQMFALLSGNRYVHLALAGVGAAAVGLSLALGLRMAWRAGQDTPSALVMAAAFAGVGLLRLPMILVVGVLAPLSIALAFRRLARDAR